MNSLPATQKLCLLHIFVKNQKKEPVEQPLAISIHYEPGDNTINFNLDFLNGDPITSLKVCVDTLSLETSSESDIAPDIPSTED
ncbi:MAG: hypothetical protein HYT94_03960 [Parcubacteria group bacterium]|nr:hypothetical protein [Parcubacteria group bacterium]